jgi:hypothetical protein
MEIPSCGKLLVFSSLNPLMPNNQSARPDERAVEARRSLHSVDWRSDAQHMEKYRHRLLLMASDVARLPLREKGAAAARGVQGYSNRVSLIMPATRCSQVAAA